MNTKERIEAKIATMDEAQLVALYSIVERIAQTEKPENVAAKLHGKTAAHQN